MGEKKSSVDICAILLFLCVAIFWLFANSYVVLFYLGISLPLKPLPAGASWTSSANIVAHNGGGDAYPEDTLEAIQIAVEQYNADIIEVDVHLTRDGKLVCIHDPILDRSTNGTGKVSSYTLEELSQFDAAKLYPAYRDKGVKIPSLERVLDYILPHPNLKMFIEIKPPASREIIHAVHQTISKYNLFERAMVISFEPHTLYKMRMLDERIKTSLIVAGWLISAGCAHHIIPTDYCDTLNSFGVVETLDWTILKLSTSVIPWLIGSSGIVISGNSTTPQEVSRMIQSGYFVDIWGIKDKEMMRKYWEVGATIAPDTLVNLRKL